MEENKGFGSTFGFLMSAVGSAVGLGNIWGFPKSMGLGGGFSFLVVYLILAVLCGLIVMIGELAIGRRTGKDPISAYKVVSKKFSWIGWLCTASPFLILFFYCALGGYCIKYVTINVGNLVGAGFGSNGLSGEEIFGNFLTSPLQGVVFGLIFVVLTMLIVMGGVSGGIEKMCSIGMPCLFVMLIACIIRACTLDGATEGLKFMFVPGYAVDAGFLAKSPSFFSVLTSAGGQMFFSLSLGMGAMLNYGSYLSKKDDITKNSILIIFFDTLVALCAGLCVIPAAVSFQASQGIANGDMVLGGPKLLFNSMQNVFDSMGTVGAVFGILFYALVVIAAISSSISLLEVLVSYFVNKEEDKGNKDPGLRKKYSLIASCAVAVGAILVCVDGLGSNGVWVPFQDLVGAKGWNDCWLDFFDMLSEGVMMPLGALLMCIMIGYEIGPDYVREECCEQGNKFGIFPFFKICVKFVTPVVMALILYGQIMSFFVG